MSGQRTSNDATRLARLLADDRLNEREREAFDEMAQRGRILTARQRTWVDDVYRRLELDADEAENLWSDGAVPVGRPVDVPEVLRVLPKRPPGRRT